MPHTNVKSAWVDGNLVFYDKSAAEILTIDGTNRKVSIPSGSAFDNAGSESFTGTQAFDDIVGNDASLGISGQAAAQGGDVAIAGGDSSTATNAGGAVTITGGTGNTSGAGGAVSLLGGTAGATGTGGNVNLTGGTPIAGVGGAIVVAGGAGVGTNKAGGAVSATGGVATGSGTGGAVTLTGGDSAGASGTGGSINLASGAPTGGTDGAVNVQTVSTGKLGFFGVTAVVRPTALTQTYSTADATLANNTFTNLATTAATTTSPWGFASQAQADAIATKVNALGVDVDDLKQFVNSAVDKLQALGLLQ